jgi:hypothetical protein
MKNKFICMAYSISDKNGSPHGLIWLLACFTNKNYRLLPVGWCSKKLYINLFNFRFMRGLK